MPNASKPPEATVVTKLEPCRDCVALDDELLSANGHWVSLVLQQERMVRDDIPAASTLDSAIRKARRRRDAVVRLLTAHHGKHEDLPRPKIQSAGNV
jgi:hypothetical protein